MKIYFESPSDLLQFFNEANAILLCSLFVSGIIFILWYKLMYIPKQWQEKQSWLTQNRSLLSKHLMLRHLLSLLGKNTEACKCCQSNKMQLWNFSEDILVVRCKSCKMTYSLHKSQSELVELILLHLEDSVELTKVMMAKRHELLGIYLSKVVLKQTQERKEKVPQNPLEILEFNTMPSVVS